MKGIRKGSLVDIVLAARKQAEAGIEKTRHHPGGEKKGAISSSKLIFVSGGMRYSSRHSQEAKVFRFGSKRPLTSRLRSTCKRPRPASRSGAGA